MNLDGFWHSALLPVSFSLSMCVHSACVMLFLLLRRPQVMAAAINMTQIHVNTGI